MIGSKDPILIRRAHLREAPSLGRIAAKTYKDTPLTAYLSPRIAEYYSHYEWGFIQRSWQRMLDPRNLTFVAVSASNPSVPVGYTQLQRIGSDEGAKRQIESRKSVWLTLAGWVIWLYLLVVKWVAGPDKSQDVERQKAFNASSGSIGEQYWEVEGRKERWYVQSCVVLEEWQGKGIGKMLMAEVIAKAEQEDVVVGLEASGPGEQLYRRVGFELLGRFSQQFGESSDVGGVMMYTPLKRRAKA